LKIEYQRTIKKEALLEGIGLHTGQTVCIKLLPGKADSGFIFQRTDLPEKPIIKALAENVVSTNRGTSIGNANVIISTIEHLLAAFIGLGIDNAWIEINGAEVPIMDGSSKIFVEAMIRAGIKTLAVPRRFIKLENRVIFQNEEENTSIELIPDNTYSLEVNIDFKSTQIGNQQARLTEINNFVDEIAPNRTFCFLHELEQLSKSDLIKGGSLSNAIVIAERPVPDEELKRLAKLFNKEEVAVRQEGILNNTELNFPNEPARHKLLDVVGDLALIGRPLIGKIIANRPGHATNINFAKKIRQMVQNKTKTNAPVYNPDIKPLLSVEQIQGYLPHRHPFLLVDKILTLDENAIVGIKNVTYDEYFLKGHFPNEPVFPGVLTIEAMAQTGGVFVLYQKGNPQDYITYFLKIDNAKFKRKIVPGDSIIIKMELKSPIRRGLCEMHGTAWVGTQLAVEADMLAQVSLKEGK